MTLFLPRRGAGFVSPDTGGVSLQRVLVPVDHSPAPDAAAEAVEALVKASLLGRNGADAAHRRGARDAGGAGA